MFFFRDDSQLWQADFYREEYAQHREALERLFNTDEPEKALQFLRLKISSQLGARSSYSELCAFISILLSFEFHAAHGGLSGRQIKDYFHHAQKILENEGLQKHSIHHCFFNQRLHQALSKAYQKEGRHWLARWHEQVASINRGLYLITKNDSLDLSTVEMLLDKGQSQLAIGMLGKILDRKLSLKNLILVKLLFVKAYHMAGKPLKALEELREIPEEDAQLRLLS